MEESIRAICRGIILENNKQHEQTMREILREELQTLMSSIQTRQVASSTNKQAVDSHSIPIVDLIGRTEYETQKSNH
ncbi:conserved hypothetical protein [Ricinus communis]|uniref:Uncharacterized protein n=1 Tax=Ricinus communis TaxID=3988 RepID=B9SC91_RICCO|nr:conserved hypothetical protein [Ricinus communis]